MRLQPRLAVFALAALLSVGGAAADPVGPYPYVSAYGGYTLFDGWQRLNGHTLRDFFNAGARVGFQWNTWLGAEATVGFTPTEEDAGGVDEDGVPLPVSNPGSGTFMHGSAAVTLSPYTGLFGAPFVLIGAGASRLEDTGGVRDTTWSGGNLEFGGGLNFWITDRIGARIEGRDLFALEKDPRGFRTQTLILSAGVTYAIGAKGRDSDQDGVGDRDDEHANTPKGAAVNARGVPIDSDGDGVFDGIDKHPGTPKGATVDAFGVPSDADADSVWDGLDLCADTPKGARVDEKGCPTDEDADKVFDGLDQCPGTPPGFPVDERGCTRDSDADGVPDDRDSCASTPAGSKVDSTGCVPAVQEVRNAFDSTGVYRIQVLGQPRFESGKAVIAPEARALLDAVGQVLTERPELEIEIGGHTDTRGSASANLKLSQDRAKAARDYLVQHFPSIKPERLKFRGYGETQPLVKDTTPENMALNRRVEFKVTNREALEKKPANSP